MPIGMRRLSGGFGSGESGGSLPPPVSAFPAVKYKTAPAAAAKIAVLVVEIRRLLTVRMKPRLRLTDSPLHFVFSPSKLVTLTTLSVKSLSR